MWPVYLQVLRDAHNTRDASYVIGEVPTGIALAIVAIGARTGGRPFRNPLRPQGFPPRGAILRR
ncbi:MAG TPA: hypothetical protein VFI34_06300, partial [Candidatus Limnocylindrales bacterium]|nr:hypothetical protein [Candidatus Limnocylindrales bacterium]